MWPLFPTIFIPLLLTRVAATATAGRKLGQESVLLNQTVSAQRQGRLFVVLDKLSIDYVVPLAEIEDTIDLLSLKVDTLQHATSLENLKPIRMSTGHLSCTYFRVPLPLHIAKTVCDNYGLKPLTITDITRHFYMPYPLLFHLEIISSAGRLNCITPSKALSEQECLDDLELLTKLDKDFPQQQALKDYILKNISPKTAYITLAEDKFSVTDSYFGNTACMGEIPSATSESVKRLHEHFFSKLSEVFGHIFETIESVSYRLSETLLTLAAEEDDEEPSFINPTDVDREILDLIPTMLPNVATSDIEESGFDTTFSSLINQTHETELVNLKNSKRVPRTLGIRKKSILRASLAQFDSSVKRRLSNLKRSVSNNIDGSGLVPNTFFFAPDQTAYSFRLFVKSFIPVLNEDILTAALIIIQNQKDSLFKTIGPMLGIPYSSRHLTRAVFSAKARIDQTRLFKVLPINSLRPPKEPMVFTMETNRSNIEPTGGTHKSLGMITANSPTNKEVTRTKRSWGTFWGSALSLATQDDMDRILKHELDMADNDLKLSKAMSNITLTNSQLIASLKSVTSGVEKLVSEEKTIFSQIDSIMTTEERLLEQLNELVDTTDKTTTLVADYQLIQLQISLLIDMTNKIKSLVNSILTHSLDTTLIPLSIIKPHVSDNLRLTLQSAEYQLKYTPTGTVLNIKIPVLSHPYHVYKFTAVPWYSSEYKWLQFKAPPPMAINAIGEIIPVQNAEAGCSRLHKDYICDANNVFIYKAGALYDKGNAYNDMQCALNILKLRSGNPQDLNCDSEWIPHLENQRYIIVGNKMTISSPINDSLISDCKDKPDNNRQNLYKGINVVTTKQNCHYETSQLVIHSSSIIHLNQQIADTDDIDTVNTLSLLEMLLQQDFPDTGKFPKLKEQLQKYNDSLGRNKMTVEELRKTMANIDRIYQISEFDPTTINFDHPFATSNMINIMFWIIIAALISSLVYSYYMKLPTHCTYCTVLPVRWLKRMCCVCLQVVQQTATNTYDAAAQNDAEAQDVQNLGAASAPIPLDVTNNHSYEVTQFLQHNPTPVQWVVQKGAYNAYVIQAVVKGSDSEVKCIRFNTITNNVTGLDNSPLNYIPSPPQLILDQYQAMLKYARPTVTFTDNEGTIRHKVFMHLTYDPSTSIWHNAQSGLAVTGIPNPQEYCREKCY